MRLARTTFTFMTMDVTGTGALVGEIFQIGGSSRYPAVVSLQPANASNEHASTLTLESAGLYEFQGIIPGEYVLKAFLDRDGNGVWSPGRLRPFKPAEPFAVYPEEITIRSGIENRGINLALYGQ